MPGPSPQLTDVELIWLEGRVERWIRFGRPAADRIIDRRRRVVSFLPGAVFALVHWEGGRYGTTVSRIWVLEALATEGSGCRSPYVKQAVEILLDLKTWTKVEAAFLAIDAIEATGLYPSDIAPDHWRHIGHRIGVAQAPTPYTCARHSAWLMRKQLTDHIDSDGADTP